jgi:hypothetical protein
MSEEGLAITPQMLEYLETQVEVGEDVLWAGAGGPDAWITVRLGLCYGVAHLIAPTQVNT